MRQLEGEERWTKMLRLYQGMVAERRQLIVRARTAEPHTNGAEAFCRRPVRGWPDGRCGTVAGYEFHRQHDGPPCPACREAQAEYRYAKRAVQKRRRSPAASRGSLAEAA